MSQLQQFKILLSKLEAKKVKLNKINDLFSVYRLITFLTGIAATLIAFFFFSNLASIITAAIFIIVFLSLMQKHNKVVNGIKKLQKWIELKKLFLAKTTVDWKSIPQFESDSTEPPTPIETDLNIIGNKSLLQLINFAFTNGGKSSLRNMFTFSKIDEKVISEKQSIIKELITLKRFRHRFNLTTLMSFGITNYKSKIMDLVSNTLPIKTLNNYTIILSILAPLTIILFILSHFGTLGGLWGYSFIIYLIIYYSGWKYIKSIHSTADMLYDDVRKFSPAFRLVEQTDFSKHPNLMNELKPLIDKNHSPVKFLDSIKFTLELLTFRKNPFIWLLLALLFPIDYIIAIKIEKFKKTMSEHFPSWLKCFYQLEAYISLANFAESNPGYTFPRLNEENNSSLHVDKLGHPLIPADYKVCNSFTIDNNNKLSIVTGSNMSGKSTFLRTIGLNLALAYAGSVVNAKEFSFKKCDLFTCIKVSDSVTDGISYFYAEVKRLKELIETSNNNKRPILFLIDEIYKGTNNVERIKGSEALLKYLSDKNVHGLVSTHDLELINLEQKLPATKNYHFKEEIKDNKMNFDYKLHTGPCPTTNALKIMEIEGLPT